MKTVKLLTCNDAMKAHILQGALENEGIETVLHNENFSSLMKSCISNIAGVDIFVAEEDYDKAVRILKENQSWPEELNLCPFCGSPEIKLILKKGKRWRAIGAAASCVVSAVFSAFFMIPVGNNHWEYTCKQCHKTFQIPIARLKSSEEEKEEGE